MLSGALYIIKYIDIMKTNQQVLQDITLQYMVELYGPLS